MLMRADLSDGRSYYILRFYELPRGSVDAKEDSDVCPGGMESGSATLATTIATAAAVAVFATLV